MTISMPRALLILIMLLILNSSEAFSQANINDGELREIIQISGQAEVTVPYTTRNYVNFLSRNLSVFSVRDKLVYISLSPQTLEWFINQDLDYNIIVNTGTKGLVTASDVAQAMEWETYPTYTQYDSIMKYFSTQYPSLCRLDTIGFSVNNRLVPAIKISDNASVDENEPEVFYSSTMHGDETGGFVLMLRFIDYLLKNYNTIDRVRNLVDNLEIWINPLANPDGTYTTGNTITNPIRNNANGFNLNRSFPDPMDPSIVVPKENVDMIRFMREHKFVISANFHSGAEVVNYPWDIEYSAYRSEYHADESWFLNISRAYADTVHHYSGTGYMTDLSNGVTRGYDWYEIYGGRQDFVTWELQGREVTIELDRIKITPAAQLGLLWLYNRSSLMGYLENALFGVHGVVRDSATYAPVSAKVFISGHDKDSSHVYSDTINGSFVRLLQPGTYDLSFLADGYKDKKIANVVVMEGERTSITVDLEQDLTGIGNVVPATLSLYPNPANGSLIVKLPEGIAGDVNVRIINNSGQVIKDFRVQSIRGIPFAIDVSGLSGGSYYISIVSAGADMLGSRFIIVK